MDGDTPTHYADSDGVSIAYRVHGEGDLDLVFVPGFVSHVELLWESPATARFLRRLGSFARVVVFDKRGQGLSDRPGAPTTLEESMDDLRAVLEAASCERPAIFGVSEGGPMSTLFAATYPERVSSLVLYGTYARMVRSPDFPLGMPDDVLDFWKEMVRHEWGGPVGLRYWAPSVVGDPETERWWARLLRQGTSPAGAIALVDLYREIDVRAILPSIDGADAGPAPRRGQVVRVGQGRYLAEQIPDARYVELLEAPTTWLGPAIRTRSSTRSRSSSPAAAAPTSPSGRWRRSSSPTSSARPRRRPSSGTGAGATCSSATTRSSAVSWPSTAAAR